jgi:hypothetical protein
MEKDLVIQTITTIFRGADQHDWAAVQNALADQVWLDYTSLAGGQPALLTGQQIANAWAAFLPGFDKTHHQLSQFEVDLGGSVAKVRFSGKADHFIGAATWTVEGNYDAEVTQQNGRWRVTKLVLHLVSQSGDLSLPAKAGEVMKNKTHAH